MLAYERLISPTTGELELQPLQGVSQQPVSVFIKTLTGKSIEVEVDLHESVEILKYKIMDQGGIPIDQQRLIYAGK